ncbi:hypothetical protein ACPV54_27340, partial [Vibrio mediterranei]
MAHQNTNLTRSTSENEHQRVAVGARKLTKSEMGVGLHSRRDYEQAKAELNFLQENLSELVAYDIDTFFQR